MARKSKSTPKSKGLRPQRRYYSLWAHALAHKLKVNNPTMTAHELRLECLKHYTEDELPPDGEKFRRWLKKRPQIKHPFDPACECAECLSKRGKTFQYIRMIPNLPDGSAGIYTEGENPDDAMRKHLHELNLIGLGEGKGRREGQQELLEQAEAIRQVAAAQKAVAGDIGPVETGQKEDEQIRRHGPDYRDCTWNGERYRFTKLQAACVEVLWNAWSNKTPEVGEQTVLTEVESAGKKLRDVFKTGKNIHPAWGTMIVEGQTRGTFQLSPGN